MDDASQDTDCDLSANTGTDQPVVAETPAITIDDVTSAANAAAASATAAANAANDAVLAKVKELLKTMGHDVELVFDDVVSLARKAV